METRRKKQTQRQKNLFTLGGFVIVVTNTPLNLPSKYFKTLCVPCIIIQNQAWQSSLKFDWDQ